MIPLGERRFLFITGKGGAGKTTLSAALALTLAGRGKRVLIAMSEVKERLSTLFGVPPLGEDIVTVAPGISAVKIGAEQALREYGEMILKSRMLHHAIFENRYVKSFFAAVPGLYQWAMLGKAWFHATERLPDGRFRFDIVLFDAPATGHGLEMLRVPKIIVEIAPAGLLRRDAEAAWTMFRDPAQSGVVVLALPEDMPTNEALELGGVVQAELGLPIAAVVVNGVIERLFDDDEQSLLLSDLPIDHGRPGDEALAAGARRAITERIQLESLRRLHAGLPGPHLELPLLLDDAVTPEAVRELAAALAAQGL